MGAIRKHRNLQHLCGRDCSHQRHSHLRRWRARQLEPGQSIDEQDLPLRNTSRLRAQRSGRELEFHGQLRTVPHVVELHNILVHLPRSWGESAPDDGIATIAALKFVEYDDTIIASPEIWLESAHECTISWCAMNFEATESENGHLHDDSESTPLVFLDKAPYHSNVSADESSSDYLPLISFSSTGDEITTFLIPGYKADDLPDLKCTYKSGSALERFWTDPKAFWFNAQDNKNIVDALGAMFTTTFESISRPGDDPARAMFRAKSFPDTMDRVAQSMTNSIRTGPNQTEIHGSVLVAEQHIQVRWPWMILPGSLVLLSVIFLIVSIVLSTRECAGWKSSALPSFYHGLSGWDSSESHPDGVDEMQRSARGIFARLGTDEDGRTRLMRTNG